MTSILVRLGDDGSYHEWHDNVLTSQTISTYTAVYADGRSVEVPCDPYPVPVQIVGDNIRGFYDQGIWTLEEIEAFGGKIAVPFAAPDGFRSTGSPFYTVDAETGVVSQQYAIEEIPPPPEPPTAEQKVADMLGGYGISLEELKAVLGLSA